MPNHPPGSIRCSAVQVRVGSQPRFQAEVLPMRAGYNAQLMFDSINFATKVFDKDDFGQGGGLLHRITCRWQIFEISCGDDHQFLRIDMLAQSA